MHFFQKGTHLASQFLGKRHPYPPPNLPVIQRPLGNFTAEHPLQAHGLAAELEGVPGVLPGTAPLVLHGVGLPQAVLSPEGNAGAAPVVFQHVALPGNPQLGGVDADAPGNHGVPPALPELRIMGILVQDGPVYGAVILRPLVLNVNQGPLAAAEFEMLQPR